MKELVGGGPKKVLYTLQTVRRIGLKNSAKALSAKNTCKACGLGMGGQQGGMTNERGEFPSVCNKSVQAQSTDIQPPLPPELFRHSLAELRELTPKELEHAGRLGNPIYKAAGEQHYREVDWDWALEHAAQRFRACAPERSFFYSSGRSSNEAGFMLQLLARLYGTNNVNNCSYYCHQATSVGLGSTIGTGTATVELADLSGCDLVFVIGANPASNHPRFIHQLKNCRDRGGEVVVINPAREPGLVKFAVPKSPASMIAGGTEIASAYLQPHIGGDIALFKGIAKALLAAGAEDRAFIDQHCEHGDAFAADIAATTWADIEAACGVARADIERVAGLYARANAAVFAWGMGMTHHQFGAQNVEYIANLALLRGMVGRRYAGLLPLRGHSNVQGIGTIGVKPVLAEAVFAAMEKTLGASLPRQPGMDTLACLEAAHQGAVDCACLVGGNLYSATPDAAWAGQALERIGFKLYLTTTLNQSHLQGVDGGEALVLPVCARDEEPQSTTQESMFNYVRLSDGGIQRLDNARSEVAILAELAARILPEAPVDCRRFADHDTLREAIAATVPGMQQLRDIGVAKAEFHVRGRLMHRPEFGTNSGRAAFQVHPIPRPREDDYPLLLASVRSEGQFNSIIYEESDSYRYGAGRDAVLLSPEDIQRLGLAAGQRVDVVSANGRLAGVSVQPFDLPPGNMLAYYPEANVLCQRRVDPRSRTPNFKSVPVRIEV
ncbi:FdhF/YdeP family oxidoreductase [Parahaliea mediterranea]|uniref:FdhF/YdeP family oxidoreductase n=1 Tax=Parahaliea mediterranea TaxID=651086 RepID=UPI000E2E686B|nr:FdhF/YdeP family oxidoreductase [Parahaliea mediterranea]